MNTATGLLQLISAAVTPVVMISACATLILGINNKQSSISERLRALVAECRQTAQGTDRRTQLTLEAGIFYRRFLLAWIALSILYGAVICFISTALVILITQQRGLHMVNGTLALFVMGIVLMLSAVMLELAETALSTRGLRTEMRDVFPRPPRA